MNYIRGIQRIHDTVFIPSVRNVTEDKNKEKTAPDFEGYEIIFICQGTVI
jgi:hypothetical protein